MGFNVTFEDDQGLQMYLTQIQKEAEMTREEMLRKSGDILKEFVVAELNKHRRPLAVRYKGRPAMADDVKKTIRTNKWGEKYVSVRGGKMTGTLWHLVNDGNLHSTPTHFMDNAIAKFDREIDKIWDEVMK